METVKDQDGNDKIVWDYSSPIAGPYYNYPTPSNGAFRIDPVTGNLGIGTPAELDPEMNLGIGETGKHIDAYRDKYKLVVSNSTEWARVDKDNNLVHLDMDLCFKGPHNAYTALAIGIWNAALEKAAEDFDLGDDYYYDEVRESILRLKK